MECLKTGAMNQHGIFTFYCENGYICHYKDNPHELIEVLGTMRDMIAFPANS